ncbi:RDD family protein [Hoyosella altamirensis]|uniref:Putative RDD family membrane protein YckC n=1 Tax=Hoyosella altamirensis TaxID=616997 RepID=A0A839RS41_9ACTN|nr:RDD family protein [Hoyosella altamirensis]MBB3038936.1 putative RDD family membrane protein YckC [Hoyosella altamirensis]
MSRITGSWLYGPSAALPKGEMHGESKYKGEALGLPEDGPGSLPTWLRRSGAFFADIFMAAGVAAIFTFPEPPRNWSLLVWFMVAIFAVLFFSFTPGQALFGLRVQRVDRAAPVGLWRSALRAFLVSLLIPAAIWDRDGRGLHDRLTGTAIVRTR